MEINLFSLKKNSHRSALWLGYIFEINASKY